MNLNDTVPLYTGEELDAMPIGRAAMLETAASHIGPQDPDKFWSRVCPELMGKPHRISWCGGFYLWCLTETIPYCREWQWKWGDGFLSKHKLLTTKEPQPGDLAYFGKPYHHYAMIEIPIQGKLIHTIDGNQGIAPDELVGRRHWGWSDVHTFYSIETLI